MSSYAIESKKRKFDRILESLTDRTAQQSQSQASATTTSLTSRSNEPSTGSTLRQELLAAAKRRRVTPALSKSASHTSLAGHYLPSSRAAFLERLETFRHITKWHIPSTSAINAAMWAKRGWVCVDVDTVSCPSCSERVTVDLNVTAKLDDDKENTDVGKRAETSGDAIDDDTEQDDMAVEIYEALVKKYSEMITGSHADRCPWKKRGCNSSIQRIEGLLNAANAIDSMRERCQGIVGKVDDIPNVLDLPAYHSLLAPREDYLLQVENIPANISAIKLAVCGWQFKEADVVECKHCFRSLGLWLYRGTEPTVENLDAIESHLEYCPWRSPDAQDTELMVHHHAEGDSGEKMKFPGWALVYHAIEKQLIKRTGLSSHMWASSLQKNGSDVGDEALTPEQREKRMRDLVRRIKEIRKPFNLSGLLRKKDRSEK